MKFFRSTAHSPYMEFAKLRSSARYNLASSGVMSYPLAELPVSLKDLEINGPTIYGYAPLQERLARKSGVTADCVVAAAGTSMANHLAMAATFDPGDEVLVEEPTYELILSAAKYLGAEIRRFPRRFDSGFQIDPGDVASRVTPRTRLIIVTNLHNPSGAFTDERTLTAIGDIARGVGARVLVDEVYLETLFDQSFRSAFHLGNHFVCTTSLTKAYGLSGVRCGWVLAEPELARHMWRINDLYGATPAHPAELLSVIALDNLDKVTSRAKAILDTNRHSVSAFLDSQSDLECFRPENGTVFFPKLPGGDTEGLFDLLMTKYETSIVPGKYFDMPEHFRIGIGGPADMTAEGLTRLGQALKAFHQN